MPTVSLIIPGYNVEETIGECLSSCFAQTYADIEVIFINDGSTDDTEKAALQFQSDPRFRYVRQENQGANAARKNGYRIASGSVVGFVDGDDWISADTVETVIRCFAEHEAYDIVCFDYDAFGSCAKKEKGAHIMEEYSGYDFLEAVLSRRTVQFLMNKHYRRDFLEKADFLSIPSITMGDDMAACVRMGLCQPHVFCIPEKFYHYRKEGVSVSNRVNPKYLELLDMMEDICEQLQKAGLYEKYKDYVEYNRFLNFYYYVVRNRYPVSDIQRTLYADWKKRRISLRANPLIRAHMRRMAFPVRCLTVLIHHSFAWEVALTKVYAVIRKFLC